MQPTTSASVLPSTLPLSSLGPSFPIYVSSFSPSIFRSLPPSSNPFQLFPSSDISHRYVLCPELLFILISRAFCFSVVSGLRRKYKIIMIIMSHFTRNNTVGAGIRHGSRAIRRANNVGRRGSVISRCSADPRSFLHPHTLLFLLSSLSLLFHPSPFNGTPFFHPCVCLRPPIFYVLYFSMCIEFSLLVFLIQIVNKKNHYRLDAAKYRAKFSSGPSTG